MIRETSRHFSSSLISKSGNRSGRSLSEVGLNLILVQILTLLEMNIHIYISRVNRLEDLSLLKYVLESWRQIHNTSCTNIKTHSIRDTEPAVCYVCNVVHIICVSISICSMYNERELLFCCVAVSCVYFFICVFYIKRICILCIPDHVCLPPLSTLHGSVKRSLFFSKCCYKTESGNKIVTPEV